MSNKTKWYDSDDPERFARGFGWTILHWLVVILVVGGVISAAVWGISVATSDVRGRGEAIQQRNDADNRIFAQEYFEETFADVRVADQQLNTNQQALDAWTEANPNGCTGPTLCEGDRLRTVVTGSANFCRDVQGNYESEARSYTSEQFRSSDLPARFNPNDPVFADGTWDYSDYDCEVAR